MGFKFRKSFKIAPGVKLNFNKKSAGITFGGKGFHYTLNSKGKRTASVGIPGTGLSYSKSGGGKSAKKETYSKEIFENKTEGMEKMKNKSSKKGCLPAIIIGVVLACIIGACGGNSNEITETTTAITTVIEAVVTSTDSTEAVIITTDVLTTTQIETTTNPETTEKKTETTKNQTTTEKKTTTAKKSTTTQRPITEKVTTTKSSAGSSEKLYVLNTNTNKFHYPSCNSVSKIKPENYDEYEGTREKIIAMGYDPCGNCHP